MVSHLASPSTHTPPSSILLLPACRNALARVYVNSFGFSTFLCLCLSLSFSACVFWARFGFDKSVLGGVSVLFCSVRFSALHSYSFIIRKNLTLRECVCRVVLLMSWPGRAWLAWPGQLAKPFSLRKRLLHDTLRRHKKKIPTDSRQNSQDLAI